jgi:hypothetical protein
MLKKTYRSTKYLNHVRSLPCCICGEKAEAHHMGGGMGIKGPDLHAIPLCRLHHSEYHYFGQDTFWDRHNMDKWKMIVDTLTEYVEGLCLT